MENNSLKLSEVVEALNGVLRTLDELAHSDVSGLHVDRCWSDIPYVDDHVAFVRDQLDGLLGGLREGPPAKHPKVAVVEPE